MNISRNILWNTLSSVLPIVAGVVIVPALIHHLGAERFGVLSGVWVLIGYFSIFDLGLGRTLTKAVADQLGAGRHEQIRPIISTTLLIVALSGVAIGFAIMLVSGPIARKVVGHSMVLVAETSSAIVWLSISLPFVLAATALGGLLEAYQRFALLSAVRVPMGALIYLVPLALIPFTTNIGTITAGLALLRVVNMYALLLLSFRVVPSLRGNLFVFRRELVKPLLAFGGWLTVSNIVGPVMVYFDRFMIAGILGSTAIAFYTVPYDVVTRLWVFPTAIQGVLFPALIVLRAQDFARLTNVFVRSSRTTLLILTPALFGTVLFANDGLRLWVGSQFALKSTLVAKILMIGVMFNAMARTPFVFVQSEGRASWAAMVHLIELPIYVLTLWWSLRVAGIEGAAYAWAVRMVIDTVVFYALAVRLENRLFKLAIWDLLLLFSLCALVVGVDWLIDNVLMRGALVLVAGVSCCLVLFGYLRGALGSSADSRPVLGKAP
jgi:O-antigen/teichoic acid export membrane protein